MTLCLKSIAIYTAIALIWFTVGYVSRGDLGASYHDVAAAMDRTAVMPVKK